MQSRNGRQVIPDDLFADARLKPAGKPLTVFRAGLTGCDEAGRENLSGHTNLKAIALSSSIAMPPRLAERIDDVEIVFGSESILSKVHLAIPTRVGQC